MKTAFLCAITGLLIGTAAFGQRQTFVPANDVSFSVSAEHRSYQAGERIVVQYEITNVSNASVYVPQEWDDECPPTLHIRAWFEDSSGRHFVPGYAGSCSPSGGPATERMSKQPVLLKPGQRLKGHVTLDTSLFGLKAGEYSIEAVLSGWNDADKRQSDLQKRNAAFIRGEVPTSTRITLTP